jgi:hypothetical protein
MFLNAFLIWILSEIKAIMKNALKFLKNLSATSIEEMKKFLRFLIVKANLKSCMNPFILFRKQLKLLQITTRNFKK